MEEIIKKLNAEMVVNQNVFTISLFGANFAVSETIITMTIITIVMCVFALFFVRAKRFSQIPSKLQNIIEIFVEFINNFTKEQLGHYWRGFAPYFGTILLFLIFANMISIFNFFPSKEFLVDILHIEAFHDLPDFQLKPPTKDINVAATLALMSITLLLFASIYLKGIKGFLKTFIHPSPIMLPFKILDYGIRPLTLTMRLFGNIFAAFVVMELLLAVFPFIAPGFASLYFDLFDGILQAYIFVFLTSIYLHENLEELE